MQKKCGQTIDSGSLGTVASTIKVTVIEGNTPSKEALQNFAKCLILMNSKGGATSNVK